MANGSDFAHWRFEQIEKRLDRAEEDIVTAKVLAERVENMAEAFKAIRNALYAAAGGFVLLFAGVMTKVIE